MLSDRGDLPKVKSFTSSLGMRLVRIEPGEFTMGFDDGPLPDEVTAGQAHRSFGDFDEHPTHEVKITRPFYMGVFEVTNSQYEQFEPRHHAFRSKLVHHLFQKKFAGEEETARTSRGIPFSKGDDEAVVYVSWYDATRFCEWLSGKETHSYRLPTEAEWEFACRAGTTSAFHTGDMPPEECLKKVSTGLSRQEAVSLRVGESSPNPWGLYDMHGNVEEWCLDWYGPYKDDRQMDPVGPADGDFRVTRGGSHSTEIYFLRSANRMGMLPEDRHWLTGFRVAVGQMPRSFPSPPPPLRRWQRDVRQRMPSYPGRAPDPNKPYFEGPRKYVKIPEDSKGPLFSRHNHDPALTRCPNGDLLAIWYTCVTEPGRELALAASRLRWGAKEWDEAAPFWDAPDRNDHAPALWFDGRDTLYHFNGLSVGAGYRNNLALIMRTSKDNGVTWSKASFVNPERGVPSQPVACVIRTREGHVIFPSDAPHSIPGRGSVLWVSPDDGRTWAMSEGVIAGIHAGVVQLTDGRLMAFGRRDYHGTMPKSTSSDMGKTWSFSPSPFPPIGGGQRLILMRLREGPMLLASFSCDRTGKGTIQVTDISGTERPVTGLFAALSFDEGETWPCIRLISDDGPGREVEAMDGRLFTMGFDSAEPLGYLAGCQTDDDVIHVISSRQHYAFNLAWLRTPPPAKPVTE